MNIKVNEEEFELSTKLLTTKRIEWKFKKPYLRILENIQDMKAEEQVDLMACGVPYKDGKEDKDEEKRFKSAMDEVGIGDLSDYLEKFIDALQYPGLSEEEIEEKKLEKIKKQKHMKEIGLIN